MHGLMLIEPTGSTQANLAGGITLINWNSLRAKAPPAINADTSSLEKATLNLFREKNRKLRAARHAKTLVKESDYRSILTNNHNE